jgi:hypothetical protein
MNPDGSSDSLGNNCHQSSYLSLADHDFSPEDLNALLGGVLDHHDESCPTPFHQESLSSNVASGPSSSRGCTPLGNSKASDHAQKFGTEIVEVGSSRLSEDGDDDKVVDRTERKRYREKQRRVDVNKQFVELTACLRQVESEFDSEELRSAALPSVFSPSNRADLLARTVALMNALHQCCKRRKTEVDTLKADLENAKKAGEEAAAKLKESIMAPQNVGGNRVMMMVPMMIGNDGQTGMMPMMNPWGMNMPQAFMPMPSNQTAALNSGDCRNDGMNSGLQGKQPSSDVQSSSTTTFTDTTSATTMMNFNGSIPMPSAHSMPWSMASGSAIPMPFPMQQIQPSVGNMAMFSQSSGHQVVKPENTGNSGPIESNLAHCA